MRGLYLLLFVFAGVCLSAGGYQFVSSRDDNQPPPFEFAAKEVSMGEVTVGVTTEFQIVVHNPALTPRRILGMNSQCSESGCFRPLENKPILISPGGTVNLRGEFEAINSGPFDVSVNIYLDEQDMRTTIIHVTGIAVEAPHATKP